MASTAAEAPERPQRGVGRKALWGSVALVGLLLGVQFSGLALYLRFEYNVAFLAAALGAVGVVSYVGFLLLSNYLADENSIEGNQMRTAIAGSFVMTYFTILALFVFSDVDPTAYTQRIIDDLLSQVGLVVGFYFASTTAIEYARLKQHQSASPAAEGDRGSTGA